jgi:hypothetical protein
MEWEVNVYDESLPPEIGQLYDLQRPVSPQCVLCIRHLQIIQEELKGMMAFTREVLEHLARVLKILEEE